MRKRADLPIVEGTSQPAVFAQRLIALRRLDWVVYAKPPFGGPAQVLAYPQDRADSRRARKISSIASRPRM
jgi:hypothetical protein